jgi:site-specific DNA recombinase
MTKIKKHSRALGYCRCSTAEQANEGMSLEVQRSKILAYCSLNDMELADTIIDAGISGKSLSRPGIQEVLERLRSGEANAIVVLKLDRLSRSTRDVLQLTQMVQDNDWQLHSIGEKLDSSSASGRFTITILSVLAQMELELVGERTSQALQHKKSNGETLGTTPMGFTSSTNGDGLRILVPNETEQSVLKKISSLRESGSNYSEIARNLNKDGIPTKRGGRWYPSTVRYLLQKVIPTALFV